MTAAAVLRSTPLGGPTPKWMATYRNAPTSQEVIVSSIERPPKVRTFRVARHGQIKFQRVDLTQLPTDSSNNTGGTNMARAATTTKSKSSKAKAKSRKAKAAEADELDEELEGLDELDDIEAELDEEPDEVEEDEEEEEKPKRTRTRKGKAAAGKAKTGKAKEAKKTSGRAKAKAKASDNGSTKEGIGTTELAEEAGVTPRELRVFLRGNAEKFPKPDGGYRWPSLENKTAQRIVKAVKAQYEEE